MEVSTRLGLPGALAVVERLDHADRGQEAVAGVAERGQAPERARPLPDGAVLIGDAGQRTTGLVVAGRIRTGTRSKPRVWQ